MWFRAKEVLTRMIDCLTYKGVRQGCIVAPLLYTLYVNDLPRLMKDSVLRMTKVLDICCYMLTI